MLSYAYSFVPSWVSSPAPEPDDNDDDEFFDAVEDTKTLPENNENTSFELTY